MPYRGGELTDFAAPLDHGIRRFGKRATEKVGDDLKARVKRHTPVAKITPAQVLSFGARGAILARGGRVPGTLKESWQVGEVTMIERGTGARFTVPVFTLDPVAPHVEWNTVPHIIVPKKPGGFLTVPTPGGLVFAKLVHHPGTTGQHMMATALVEVAASWRETVALEWAKEARTIWSAT